MQLTPAPGRQLKTWSMWIGIFIGSYDAFELLLKTFGNINLLSPTAILALNAVLGFLIVPAKLILQNIAVTTQEKSDLVSSAAAQPMQDGHANVEVKINDFIVPSTPGAKP